MLPPPAYVRAPRLNGLAILLALLLTLVSPASSTARSEAGATTPWGWPIDLPHSIARPFIAPETEYSTGHRGIDIASALGARVAAPADGVVYFVGFVVNRPVLSIRHPGGVLSSYEPVDSALVEGAVVHRGETIGTVVGAHCTPSCLHFGVRLNGEYVSPLNYLGGIPRSVLLPTRELP